MSGMRSYPYTRQRFHSIQIPTENVAKKRRYHRESRAQRLSRRGLRAVQPLLPNMAQVRKHTFARRISSVPRVPPRLAHHPLLSKRQIGRSELDRPATRRHQQHLFRFFTRTEAKTPWRFFHALGNLTMRKTGEIFSLHGILHQRLPENELQSRVSSRRNCGQRPMEIVMNNRIFLRTRKKARKTNPSLSIRNGFVQFDIMALRQSTRKDKSAPNRGDV